MAIFGGGDYPLGQTHFQFEPSPTFRRLVTSRWLVACQTIYKVKAVEPLEHRCSTECESMEV